jgi:fructose 1,6-bisphosphatase
MGPAVAELEFEERPNEPFLFFAADKTDPGAYNLPVYLAFADPMNTPGLMLSPAMSAGFRFVIMDVAHTEGDRIIELGAPEDLYAIATLLRDTGRHGIQSVASRTTGSRRFRCPRRDCTTSPEHTPARMTRSCWCGGRQISRPPGRSWRPVPSAPT